MLVKVWGSGGGGDVEDDAMVGGSTVLSGQGLGSLAFAAVQAAWLRQLIVMGWVFI